MLHLLKASLTNCFIGGLRSDKEHWCMIPVSCLYWSNKTCNTRAVLSNTHCDFSCRSRISITNQTAIGFMRHIPKCNVRLGKKIGDRHKCGANYSKSMFNAVHLQYFYKSLLCCHFCHYIFSSKIKFNSKLVDYT